MKNVLTLSFILAALTAPSAFAAPQPKPHQPFVASATQPVDVQAPTVDEKSSVIVLPRTGLQGDIYVAENRPEFGSRYQRY